MQNYIKLKGFPSLFIILCSLVWFSCEDPNKTDAHPPLSGFTFTPASLQEGGVSEGMKAGDIAVQGGTAPYTIELESDERWGRDNGKFAVQGTELVTAAELSGGPYYIQFRVADSTGASLGNAQILFVAFGGGPTDFTFTANRLMENTAGATGLAPAGTFSAEGGIPPYSYNLVEGNGTNDVDNSSFHQGAQGVMARSALAAGTYKIYVRASDRNGKHFQKALTVTIDLYAPPTFGAADFVTFPANPDFEGLTDYYTSFTTNLQAAMNIFLDGRLLGIPAFRLAKYETTKKLWWDVYQWATKAGEYSGRSGDAYTFLSQSGTALPAAAPSADDEGKPQAALYWRNIVLWLNAFSEKNNLTPVYYSDTAHQNVLRSHASATAALFTKWDASGYRLPSEVEWEYAARGGEPSTTETDPFMWAYAGTNDHDELVKKYGVVDAFYFSGLQPVGSLLPNTAGLYDMSGNVAEFCGDYGGLATSGASTTNHTVEAGVYGIDDTVNYLTNAVIAGTYNYRITRGAYRGGTVAGRKLTYRNNGGAYMLAGAAANANVGFRIAQTAPVQ
jgi:formylglycine-generating enzyme required for sulfatase activity